MAEQGLLDAQPKGIRDVGRRVWSWLRSPERLDNLANFGANVVAGLYGSPVGFPGRINFFDDETGTRNPASQWVGMPQLPAFGNPFEGLLGRFSRDPYRSGRSQWREGSQLEDWQRAPPPEAAPAPPGQPAWMGAGPSMPTPGVDYLLPGNQNRVGPGRGTTIAEGRAAQEMFDAWRIAATQAQLQQQARQAMERMFRNAEE